MTDIVMIEGGICGECGHDHQKHEGNTTCDVEGCECDNMGSY